MLHRGIATGKWQTNPETEQAKTKSCAEGLAGLAGNLRSRFEFKRAVQETAPSCLKHARTYANFARSNVNPSMVLPPAYGPERWTASLSRSTLIPYLIFSRGDGMLATLILCAALGLFSGALSTFLYLQIRWQTYKFDPVAYTAGVALEEPGSYMSVS